MTSTGEHTPSRLPGLGDSLRDARGDQPPADGFQGGHPRDGSRHDAGADHDPLGGYGARAVRTGKPRRPWLIGGLAAVTHIGVTWSYPLAAWTSWIVPLALFESGRAVIRTQKTRGITGPSQNFPSTAALSLPAIDINARR